MTTLEAIRAALPAYPIEVTFPDISRWRAGNTGIDYLHTFDSGKPGKHVMILALTHGNEVSGAIAVDALLTAGLRPVAGRLSLGFGNVGAYEHFSAENADATRYLDEDMNRVWTPAALDGTRDSRELARARAMRPLLDTVDLLLDIHSMHEASAPLMMTGAARQGDRAGRRARHTGARDRRSRPCERHAAARLRRLRRSGEREERAADRDGPALRGERARSRSTAPRASCCTRASSHATTSRRS